MATEKSEKEAQPDAHKDILETARARFKLCEEAESELRDEMLDDLKFRAGQQWDPQVLADRKQDRRPCLTINRLPQATRQITNDQRQNRPSIKVYPVDDHADVDTAKILQGLIKHIEYNSNADTAYDVGCENQVNTGRGYLRVLTDYCDPLSFDQELLIKQVADQFTVYLDPASQEPDGSDAEFGFVFEDLTPDKYEALHGKPDDLPDVDGWRAIGDVAPGWATERFIRVADYFYREYKDDTLVQLSDGSIYLKSSMPKDMPEGVEVTTERKTKIPVVRWAQITGAKVLEKTDFPSRWIPIIPIYGDKLIVEGKKIIEGAIRHAKDSQRIYNYQASNEAETIALAPRVPWIGAKGQFKGMEARWQEANRKNLAYLEYDPVTVNGTLAPPPQRNVFEAPVQAITQARMLAADDIKATTGIYDDALGNSRNEKSGIAIQRRNQQTQTSNFHFVDNLSKSIRHLGRILIDAIPFVYDATRAVRIIGEDGEQEIVKINEFFGEGKDKKIYNFRTGKYDVVVDTGPSYATKRQEAADQMIEFTKAMPQAVPVIIDLIAGNLDLPGGKEMAERLKKTLPPGVADDKGKNDAIPPEIQAKMQQNDQMIEQLTAKLNEAHDQLDTKTIELESKERIEFAKIQANIEIEMAKMGSKEAQTLLAHEVQQIQQRLELLNISQPIETEIKNEGAGEMQPEPQMNNQPAGGTPQGGEGQV